MNNSNRFLELSVKQQLALCQIGKDLIEIDTKIDETENSGRFSGVSNLGDRLLNIFIKILPCVS